MTCDKCNVVKDKKKRQSIRCKIGWHKVGDRCKHEDWICILCGMQRHSYAWGDGWYWSWKK